MICKFVLFDLIVDICKEQSTNNMSTIKKEDSEEKDVAPLKVKKKTGLPKGRTNNPNGRPKGSHNLVTYDVKKAIAAKVSTPAFIKGLFDDIKGVDDLDKRAKLKVELVKLFVPRPLNDDEEKDKIIKSAIFDKLSGNEEVVEDT